jgi:hypothetical protein
MNLRTKTRDADRSDANAFLAKALELAETARSSREVGRRHVDASLPGGLPTTDELRLGGPLAAKRDVEYSGYQVAAEHAQTRVDQASRFVTWVAEVVGDA